MPKDPEQLELNFGRIDPISEKFPRRHQYRDVRTPAECIADTVGHLRGKGRLTLGLAATLASFSGVAISAYELGDYNGRIDAANDFVREGRQPALDELVDCVEAPTFDYESLHNETISYQEGVEVVDHNAVRPYGEFLDLSIAISNRINTDPASNIDEIVNFFAEAGVNLEFDFDIHQYRTEQEIVAFNNGLLRYAAALYSIPGAVYRQSELKKIVVVDDDVLYRQKTEKQINAEQATLDANGGGEVDPIERVNGRYLFDKGRVDIAASVISGNGFWLKAVVWHEIVGHAFLGSMCYPITDMNWYDINASSGIEFSYMPPEEMTPEIIKLLESGIVTAGAYAGRNVFEDQAVTATQMMALASDGYYFYLPLTENGYNGTVLDEKLGLLLRRIKLVVPDFEEYVKAINLLF